MWKKQDDPSERPDLVSSDTPDLASLGDALAQSFVNEQFSQENLPTAPQRAVAEIRAPSSPPDMKVYNEAASDFTNHATAFIEHLPLLAKARAAYAEAIRASAEMRKVLDARDEHLRNLMTQLEQAVNLHGVKASPDKKVAEPAKLERLKPTADAGGRPIRWP